MRQRERDREGRGKGGRGGGRGGRERERDESVVYSGFGCLPRPPRMDGYRRLCMYVSLCVYVYLCACVCVRVRVCLSMARMATALLSEGGVCVCARARVCVAALFRGRLLCCNEVAVRILCSPGCGMTWRMVVVEEEEEKAAAAATEAKQRLLRSIEISVTRMLFLQWKVSKEEEEVLAVGGGGRRGWIFELGNEVI